MAEKTGIEREGAAAVEREKERLERLEIERAEAEAAAQTDLFGAPAVPRLAGRPAGSRNRTTKLFRELMISRLGPDMGLIEEILADPVEKARKLQCDPYDVWAVQMKARQHALSSVQPKPAIQVETKAAHAFVAIEEAVPDPNLGRVGLGQTAPRIAIRTVENQSLSLAISDELEEDELEE
tara:strand:+ start:496 stop:1038 length:543 start_codon:yes stop_codon:yes gene_type:complete